MVCESRMTTKELQISCEGRANRISMDQNKKRQSSCAANILVRTYMNFDVNEPLLNELTSDRQLQIKLCMRRDARISLHLWLGKGRLIGEI
jgi:hypothetical protein